MVLGPYRIGERVVVKCETWGGKEILFWLEQNRIEQIYLTTTKIQYNLRYIHARYYRWDKIFFLHIYTNKCLWSSSKDQSNQKWLFLLAGPLGY